MYQLDKNNSELLEDYKKKLKDEVNYRNEVITELEESNERSKAIILNLENENNDYVHRLDSLKALKQRIKTIYIEKIIEVNNYTVLEVEEYWKNKFNK